MDDQKITLAGMPLTKALNQSFIAFFKEAYKVARSVKGYTYPFLRHFLWQGQAARKRAVEEKKGVHVPPFMIYSVTRKCNLMCQGCYSRQLHNHEPEDELDLEKSSSLIKEAQDLGVSTILLAGGEPLTKKGLIALTCRFPRIIFPVFTNGLLINDFLALEFKKRHNVFPIISIEGENNRTDARRGAGVHSHIMNVFKRLKEKHILFGASITVTGENFEDVTKEAFVRDLKDKGARIIFYIEYIPCAENTGHLVLTAQQRTLLTQRLMLLRKNMGILFIAFPGDEDRFGGCLAAGRGFIHVTSNGRVEPCPFSPYSDVTWSEKVSLRETLKSPLLKAIRENHGRLSEHQGGCALWENREWVEATMKANEGKEVSQPKAMINSTSK